MRSVAVPSKTRSQLPPPFVDRNKPRSLAANTVVVATAPAVLGSMSTLEILALEASN